MTRVWRCDAPGCASVRTEDPQEQPSEEGGGWVRLQCDVEFDIARAAAAGLSEVEINLLADGRFDACSVAHATEVMEKSELWRKLQRLAQPEFLARVEFKVTE